MMFYRNVLRHKTVNMNKWVLVVIFFYKNYEVISLSFGGYLSACCHRDMNLWHHKIIIE